jgi:electron transfer flavoprotein-quinone oxidoreductase
MGSDKFDVIIIGAGLAGSAAAFTLAKAGKSVLLIERGDFAGGKNVSGGRLYSYALELLEEGMTRKAPLERRVVNEQIMLLAEGRSAQVAFTNPAEENQEAGSFTILRAVFDEWFAAQAEARGAMLVSGIRVDELIERDSEIRGVIAGGDEMEADLVIAADGVNSFMAQKAGLRSDLEPKLAGVGVKEIIELPEEAIENRFGLRKGEGAARMILGGTDGINGGGFLYTNCQSISLGCVLTAEALSRSKRSIHAVFQDLKMHPALQPLLEGGTTVEYSAHLVPEAGWTGMPGKLHRPGFLVVGDAAGFVINQGYTIRGMDLAIISGVAAARAVLANPTRDALGVTYLEKLKQMGLIATMQHYAGFPALMENPRLFTQYPQLLNNAGRLLFDIDGKLPRSLKKGLLQLVRESGGLTALVRDGWQILQALR